MRALSSRRRLSLRVRWDAPGPKFGTDSMKPTVGPRGTERTGHLEKELSDRDASVAELKQKKRELNQLLAQGAPVPWPSSLGFVSQRVWIKAFGV